MSYLVVNTDTGETVDEVNTEFEALEVASDINSSNEKNEDGTLMTVYITID